MGHHHIAVSPAHLESPALLPPPVSALVSNRCRLCYCSGYLRMCMCSSDIRLSVFKNRLRQATPSPLPCQLLRGRWKRARACAYRSELHAVPVLCNKATVWLNCVGFESSNILVWNLNGVESHYPHLRVYAITLQRRESYSSGSPSPSSPNSSTIHAQNPSHLFIHSFNLCALTPLPILPSLTSCTQSFAL
jgi:hypothetical protein